MLSFMRKNANSWLMTILFTALIAVFALNFGPWAGNIKSKSNFAAVVNGKTITMGQFQIAYNNEFNRRQKLIPDYNADKATKEKLAKQVLDLMVDQELLAQMAVKNGLIVPDQQLAEKIIKIFDMKDGFNRESYKGYLQNIYRTSELQYEEYIARHMLANEMIGLLYEGSKITKEELNNELNLIGSRVKLNYLEINPKLLAAKVKIDNSKLAQWKKDNILAIKNYYKDNISSYRRPQRVKARHILIKVANNASQEEKNKALAKANKILQKVRQNPNNFASIAKKESQGPSGKKGGDLGYFTRSDMVKPFSDAAFALKDKEISDVVESKFGFHIIKREGSKKAIKQSFDSVKDKIASDLFIKQEQKLFAKEKAQELLQKALKTKNLQKLSTVLASMGLKAKVKQTSWFNKKSYLVPSIGIAPKVQNSAFHLSKKSPIASEIFDINGKFYIIGLEDKSNISNKDKEQKLNRIENMLLFSRRDGFIKDFLKNLRHNTKIEYNDSLV